MYAEQGTLRGIHKRVLCDSESGQGGCRNRSDRFSPGAELTATGTNGDTTGSSSSGSVRVSIIHPGRRFIIIIRISQGFHYLSGSQVHHHHPDQSGFPLSIRVAGSSSSSGPVTGSIIHRPSTFIIIIRIPFPSLSVLFPIVDLSHGVSRGWPEVERAFGWFCW